MSGYDLPTSTVIGGTEYAIRSDFRAIIDVMGVMADPDIEDEERTVVALSVFYEGFDEMPLRDFEEAVEYMQWFVNGGEKQPSRKGPKLMDWEQDLPLIIAPVNRVMGQEVRAMEYLHWWTFLAAYREIGDCLFAQVVSIRKKRGKGEKLDKADEKFYRENRDLVDIKLQETASEAAILEAWG